MSRIGRGLATVPSWDRLDTNRIGRARWGAKAPCLYVKHVSTPWRWLARTEPDKGTEFAPPPVDSQTPVSARQAHASDDR
jgi:hypothetical protein